MTKIKNIDSIREKLKGIEISLDLMEDEQEQTELSILNERLIKIESILLDIKKAII
jgi:hypothetical protein